jgi:thiol:disulfide interchange protein
MGYFITIHRFVFRETGLMIKTTRMRTILLPSVSLIIGFFHWCSAGQGAPPLAITIANSKQSYVPDDTVLIALEAGIADRYHLYGNPLGPGIGKPLTISIRGGEGVQWLDIIKSVPKKYNPEIGGWVFAYEKQATFILRGLARNAETAKGTAIIDGLECYTSCYPVHYELPFSIVIDPKAEPSAHFASENRFARFLLGNTEKMAFDTMVTAPSGSQISGSFGAIKGIRSAPATAPAMPAWDFSPREATADFTIWMAVVFGFLAGILLNAMPCVLPVLGIKILSFARVSEKNKKDTIIHSLFFSCGVISVFLLLAGLASFANYSWGRQFQDPRALIGIITLIVVFALGMFDVFLITVPGSIANLDHKKSSGKWGDFFTGIFATVLATPCSGPFLGAVLAWAVTQPPYMIFVVYGSIGAGMSFPYIVLSSSRRLKKLVPKPGPWMHSFKGLMGFLLLGFAVYLLVGLPGSLVEPTLLFCLIVSFAVAIHGRLATFGAPLGRKLVSFVIALAVASFGLYVSFFIVYPAFSVNKAEAARQESKVWKPFSPDSLLAAQSAGRPVVVDFTANWCINCQYNTIMVLSKKRVTDALMEKGVLALVADMTMPDPVQDSLLHSLGSQSIPFLAIFPGDDPKRPFVKRDILTEGIVLKAIGRLR